MKVIEDDFHLLFGMDVGCDMGNREFVHLAVAQRFTIVAMTNLNEHLYPCRRLLVGQFTHFVSAPR